MSLCNCSKNNYLVIILKCNDGHDLYNAHVYGYSYHDDQEDLIRKFVSNYAKLWDYYDSEIEIRLEKYSLDTVRALMSYHLNLIESRTFHFDHTLTDKDIDGITHMIENVDRIIHQDSVYKYIDVDWRDGYISFDCPAPYVHRITDKTDVIRSDSETLIRSDLKTTKIAYLKDYKCGGLIYSASEYQIHIYQLNGQLRSIVYLDDKIIDLKVCDQHQHQRQRLYILTESKLYYLLSRDSKLQDFPSRPIELALPYPGRLNAMTILNDKLMLSVGSNAVVGYWKKGEFRTKCLLSTDDIVMSYTMVDDNIITINKKGDVDCWDISIRGSAYKVWKKTDINAVSVTTMLDQIIVNTSESILFFDLSGESYGQVEREAGESPFRVLYPYHNLLFMDGMSTKMRVWNRVSNKLMVVNNDDVINDVVVTDKHVILGCDSSIHMWSTACFSSVFPYVCSYV